MRKCGGHRFRLARAVGRVAQNTKPKPLVKAKVRQKRLVMLMVRAMRSRYQEIQTSIQPLSMPTAEAFPVVFPSPRTGFIRGVKDAASPGKEALLRAQAC